MIHLLFASQVRQKKSLSVQLSKDSRACICVCVCNNVRIFTLLTGLFDVKLCVCPRHLRLQLTFSSPPFPGAVKSALACLHIGLRLCSCLAIKLKFFISWLRICFIIVVVVLVHRISWTWAPLEGGACSTSDNYSTAPLFKEEISQEAMLNTGVLKFWDDVETIIKLLITDTQRPTLEKQTNNVG